MTAAAGTTCSYTTALVGFFPVVLRALSHTVPASDYGGP